MDEFVVDYGGGQKASAVCSVFWSGLRLSRAVHSGRITRPWQTTLRFFWPEISSGISNTISIRAFTGSGCGPLKQKSRLAQVFDDPLVPGLVLFTR